MLRTSARFLSATLVITALCSAIPALALPVGSESDEREELRAAPSWDELLASGVDFTAIVSLSNCSGSLVRFVNSQTTDQALVLTNGHCVSGLVAAGDAVVKAPSSRTFSLLGSGGKSSLGTLRASQLVYATMTGTDMALYKLTSTYAQIASRYRVAPLLISDKRPSAGTPIRVVSGYWRKIYSCSIDKFVYELHEGTWTFTDSIRYTEPGCEVVGGTSGSPIIHADTREIIGINNTGNESGQRCTVNNPCEVDEHGGVTAEKGASYGQQLHQVYACLTDTNDIDLSKTGCQLQKPKTTP